MVKTEPRFLVVGRTPGWYREGDQEPTWNSRNLWGMLRGTILRNEGL